MKKPNQPQKKRILARVVAEEMKTVAGGWRHSYTRGTDEIDYDLD